jgi:hypothetical protein
MERRMFDAIFERAIGRLGGLIETISAPVVEPTVIAAANAIVFDAAELQRRAAMGTMQFNQSERARAIAKQNKIFTEQSYFPRSGWFRNFLAKRHGPPIAAQHFARRGARSDARH